MAPSQWPAYFRLSWLLGAWTGIAMLVLAVARSTRDAPPARALLSGIAARSRPCHSPRPVVPSATRSDGAGAIAPHIVIVGIDSLRNDLTIPRRGTAEHAEHSCLPAASARRFQDATTPLARTYGSWMSILTGRHPVTTNARYNLMPRAAGARG